MNLIGDILEAAVDSSVDLPTLLRKCKLLAARVHNDDLAQWVDRELDGYPTEDELPAYRILRVQSYGDFYGSFGRALKGAPIPETSLLPKYRKYATTQYFTEGVSALAALAQSERSDTNIQLTWHPNLIAAVGSDIYSDYTCLRAWTSFTNSVLVGILETVRNRILDFAIRLDREFPSTTDVSSLAEIPEERSQQIFQTVFMGNVENVAYGSSEFVQKAEFHVAKGSLSSLREFLGKQNIAEEDIDELVAAVQDDDEPDQQGKLGNRTSEWIGKMVSKALSGAWNVSTSAAADLLKQAILSYYGLI